MGRETMVPGKVLAGWYWAVSWWDGDAGEEGEEVRSGSTGSGGEGRRGMGEGEEMRDEGRGR